MREFSLDYSMSMLTPSFSMSLFNPSMSMSGYQSMPVHCLDYSMLTPSLSMTYSVAKSSVGNVPTPFPVGNIPSAIPTNIPSISTQLNFTMQYAQVYTSSGFALGVDALTSSSGAELQPNFDTTWGSEFGGLFYDVPGSTSEFGISISQRKLLPTSSPSYTVSTPKKDGSSLRMVLNTVVATVVSRSFKVNYQLLDADGRTQVTNPSSRKVYMTNSVTGSTTSANCGSTSSTTGMGTCSSSVPSNWFVDSSSGAVAVTIVVKVTTSGNVLESNSDIMNLLPVATHSALSVANMIMSVPQMKYYPGSSFSVTVTADTASQVLTSWVTTLNYDSSVLSYTSVSTDSNFISAVVVASTGKLVLSTSGTSSGVADSAVSGSGVGIYTVTFKVLTSISGDTLYENILDLFVDGMVNIFCIKFVSSTQSVVQDARDGNQVSGQIYVESNSMVGIFAYVDKVDYMNFRPLVSGSTTPSITVKAVYSQSGSTSTVSSASKSCVASPGAHLIMQITSSCDASISVSHTQGGGVHITVSVDSFVTSVAFIVWYPESVFVDVSDVDLGTITFANENTPSCSAYQSTLASAKAIFTDGTTSMSLYVSPYVSIVSSDSSVASIDSSEKSSGIFHVNGIAAGTVQLSVDVVGSTVVTPTSVTVGNEVVSLASISLITYTGVEGSVSSPSSLYGTVSPEFTFLDTLTAEGETGYITALALFDDLTMQDITYDLTALDSTNSFVDVDLSAMEVSVPLGGDSFIYWYLQFMWKQYDW